MNAYVANKEFAKECNYCHANACAYMFNVKFEKNI